MAKPDGRIEKGQRLSTAISARAWNRAQDAADIVLGVRPGFGVPHVSSSQDHLTVKILKTSLDIPHEELEVGHAISINNLFTDPNGALLQTSLPLNAQSEDDLPAYSTDQQIISAPTSSIGPGVRCGVIEQVSELQDNSHYICKVRVRGLVRCRVLFLTQGASVSPPPPLPTTQSLRQYWRRYLLATDYGYGSIVAVGSRYKLNADGVSLYPAVAEALVMLG
jgi:hypothetical protein